MIENKFLKELYVTPTVEIISFACEDVLESSNPDPFDTPIG